MVTVMKENVTGYAVDSEQMSPDKQTIKENVTGRKTVPVTNINVTG
jgi:hypothetical protein